MIWLQVYALKHYKSTTCSTLEKASILSNITCNFPEAAASFFLSPVPAIVAKYWMTRLVLTVFPAPDSPLQSKTHQKCFISPYDKKYHRQAEAFASTCSLRDKDGLVFSIYNR